jgi:hypothetical protein
MTEPITCDASQLTPFGKVGPCVLRHQHDGPVHRDRDGGEWWPSELAEPRGHLYPVGGLKSDGSTHIYFSTGCRHGDMVLPDGRTGHEYCQGETGAVGAKTPAVCKFCAAPCRCDCHGEPTRAEAYAEHGRHMDLQIEVAPTAKESPQLAMMRRDFERGVITVPTRALTDAPASDAGAVTGNGEPVEPYYGVWKRATFGGVDEWFWRCDGHSPTAWRTQHGYWSREEAEAGYAEHAANEHTTLATGEEQQ